MVLIYVYLIFKRLLYLPYYLCVFYRLGYSLINFLLAIKRIEGQKGLCFIHKTSNDIKLSREVWVGGGRKYFACVQGSDRLFVRNSGVWKAPISLSKMVLVDFQN